MLTMLHNNPARVVNGHLRVDRKFHAGMLEYVQKLNEPIVSVHPESAETAYGMDLISIPLEDLSYGILTFKTDRSGTPAGPDRDRLQHQITNSTLVTGYGSGIRMARQAGIPYIMVIEYDLRTQITIATSEIGNPLRRIARALRNVLRYTAKDIPDMRHALALHCNGYPIFDETRRFNVNRLLYLDSRMSEDTVIPEDELEQRFSRLGQRPLRLLFSGRYEPMKGSVDAVRVAVECIRRGLDIEMHCYGQGSLKSEMQTAASAALAPDRIFIHDAIPYPELVKESRNFDIFICCHIQSDPSCTYLESFGSGLPVVGYGNLMWQRLSRESGVGYSSEVGDISAVASSIEALNDNHDELARMSRRARSFAIAHTSEKEFALRTTALNSVIEALRGH
jgi:colanic acid/amylovoran biosynthesis glycosyltransferase